MTQRTPSNPAIDTLLELTSYVDFSSQIQDVHDFIHGWVGGTDPANEQIGGDMGTIAVAAFDPIFSGPPCDDRSALVLVAAPPRREQHPG